MSEDLFPDIPSRQGAKCLHQTVRTVVLENSIHYGKEVCAVCGAYLRFIPKPENVEKRNRFKEMAQELWNRNMNPFDRKFVLDQEKAAFHMSPKQEAYFNVVYARYHAKDTASHQG